MRRRRTPRQNVEHVLGVLHPASRGKLVAEDDFLARVVHLRTENKTTTLSGRLDRPAGEGTRDVDHILLRVSAIYAERVELEQLTPVVLVQALSLPLLLCLLLLLPFDLSSRAHRSHDGAKSASPSANWNRTNPWHSVWSAQRGAIAVGHAARVVQIEQHRWALRDSVEQVAEFAQRVRTDDVLVEVDEIVRLGRALGRVDVEVILPEVGHHFL